MQVIEWIVFFIISWFLFSVENRRTQQYRAVRREMEFKRLVLSVGPDRAITLWAHIAILYSPWGQWQGGYI